jgi:hypothetical protein
MKTTYVLRGSHLVNKATGEPEILPDMLAMPQVISDVAPYTSPIDGRLIDGRREQREDLKRNGCVLKESRTKFDREEYRERKAQQAKELGRRHVR